MVKIVLMCKSLFKYFNHIWNEINLSLLEQLLCHCIVYQQERIRRKTSHWFQTSFFWKHAKTFFKREGGTYPLAHFLGNFREKTKKVPTRTVSRKLSEISLRFLKKFKALLPLAHFSKSCDELSLYNQGGQIMPHIGLKKEVFLSFF